MRNRKQRSRKIASFHHSPLTTHYSPGIASTTHHSPLTTHPDAGVTLLELLVVMALAAILLAVVFPSVGAGLRTLELRSAAERLAASARYARDQAVHRQRFYELEIDPQAGTITVTDFAGESRRSFELPGSVRVERILPEETRSESTRRFLFSPDGGSPAFEIILGNDRRQAVVTSNPLTGFPRITEL